MNNKTKKTKRRAYIAKQFKDCSILFLDDEELLLKSYERCLMNQPYQKFFFNSPFKALDFLDGHPCEVVVSDMRMPDMDGLTFLRMVKERYPESARITITSFTQASQIIAAINSGEVFRYITKPISDPEDIQCAIYEALQFYHAQHERIQLIEELQKQNQDLKDALREAEFLRELIPYCTKCGKANTDDLYFVRLKTFLKKYDPAKEGMGLCPQCRNEINQPE